MRALEKLQQQHKTVHAVIVGGDEVSYGKRPKDARHWREKMLREVELDATRTHFMGKLPRAQYIKVLQVSAAHVYLTYPFVLSWSLLEAMACGANIVASDTAPVREVIKDEVTGQLVSFFDLSGIASALEQRLSAGGTHSCSGLSAARHAARHYTWADGLRGYERLATGLEPAKIDRPAETEGDSTCGTHQSNLPVKPAMTTGVRLTGDVVATTRCWAGADNTTSTTTSTAARATIGSSASARLG
ncbi:MAG: glycosyltransferase [Aquincola sp.]|nr:glycosyltransferase [Aquincola sp.]